MKTQELKHDIRFHQLFAIGFGTIIGVGWLIMAGSWILDAGPLGAILAFATGAAAIGVIALCYGELGAMFPHPGGEVVYALEGMGPFAGFIIGWLLTLIYISVCAFEGLSAAWIISILFPGIGGPVLYEAFGSAVSVLDLTLAVGGTLALTWLNYRGGALAAQLQDWCIWLFGGVTLIFVISAVAGGNPEFAQPWMHGVDKTPLVGFIAVLATTPLWYSGFNTLPQALGELDDINSIRLLPRLLGTVVLAAFLFYAGVILATSLVAPREILSGAELPVAAALFQGFESPWMGRVVLVAGLFGIITTWNAMMFSGARVLFCLGRGHIISERFAAVHPRLGSPYVAVLFVGVLGSLAAFSGRAILTPILGLVAICFSICYLFAAISVLRLRRTQPDVLRPWSMPGWPWLPRLALVIAVIFIGLVGYSTIVGAGGGVPLEFLILAGWGVLGAVFWMANSRARNEISDAERRKRIHTR